MTIGNSGLTMGRQRKRTELDGKSLLHRLKLVADARGKTLTQVCSEAGIVKADIYNIIRRGHPPTKVLIDRLVQPQRVPSAVFLGSLQTLAMFLKKEIDNGLEQTHKALR